MDELVTEMRATLTFRGMSDEHQMVVVEQLAQEVADAGFRQAMREQVILNQFATWDGASELPAPLAEEVKLLQALAEFNVKLWTAMASDPAGVLLARGRVLALAGEIEARLKAGG
jgi:hypothetical protein